MEELSGLGETFMGGCARLKAKLGRRSEDPSRAVEGDGEWKERDGLGEGEQGHRPSQG